jgi:hypothetical protein
MTTGSCSVAISRSPTPTMRARQNINRERPVHEGRPAPGARTALRLYALSTCGQRRRRGLRRHAPVRDHALAPAGARGQQAMANQQVRLRPRRHRRQTLQQLQRLEHQLARAVAPRRLQLQRDAPVAPQPQALLRKGRTQDIAAQTLQPRPIVRWHPHVGVQIEALEMRLPGPARRHGLRVARVTEPPQPRAAIHDCCGLLGVPTTRFREGGTMSVWRRAHAIARFFAGTD